MSHFTFEDMKKINRQHLGDHVPLELFRSVRLIGMYQGLPLKGKNTTITIGKKIGDSIPVTSLDAVLQVFEDLKIGIPTVIERKEKELTISVDDCFCKGLPVKKGHHVCDLEGAILEGAISKVIGTKVNVKETKCNINGDQMCEYHIKWES